MESFLGTALAGAVFCLLGGQPLIILSSTGPILIFEKLLYDFSKSSALDYMELRLWVGMHACLQCLVLVAADASCVIRYVTRFTEEGFSSLISLIFISDAVKKMAATFRSYPIDAAFSPERIAAYKCECVAPDSEAAAVFSGAVPASDNTSDISRTNLTALDWSQLGKSECVKYGGSLVGNSCGYVPDLALLSFILFFGTYSTTVSLKKFKFTRYFPTKVRKLISDFSIFMSIVTFVGLDMAMGLKTPKLIVPTEFKLLLRTFLLWLSTRKSVICRIALCSRPVQTEAGSSCPSGRTRGGCPWPASPPALLVTILVFMDQQISAVIVNRKENKLKKGCGYHLDLFWVGVLLALCSLVGLPWYVAATVISIAHIDSLRMESESSAPGEQPQFLGVREQRMTGILVFVLTGTSIFLAPVLQLIPMPVLYGVFFYMGVASLSGIQHCGVRCYGVGHYGAKHCGVRRCGVEYRGVRQHGVRHCEVRSYGSTLEEKVSAVPVLSTEIRNVRQPLKFVQSPVEVCNGSRLVCAIQHVNPVPSALPLSTTTALLFPPQFWDRVKLFLMPAKHQPDHDYLRHVPLRRVHLFTLLQITCLAALWALKSTVLAIIFPVMILGLMLVRKLLDAAFSQHDLAWLDDLLPWPKRTRSNRRNCGGGKDGDMDGEKRLWWSGCDPGAADLGYRVGEEGDVWSATPTPVLQRRGHASGPRPSDVPSIASPPPPPLSRTGNGTLASRGITLHLKISCPPSPGAEAGGIQLALPQVKIEIESEDDDTDAELRDRECERGNEMTL
ncbi:hypothetical protein P4O66_000143 [Electrophorus voltai]|uniref:Bicarbonate transporter-like transmembrane domain-containing protein n=1 Tax=Electrophorus voltai TaxID=2609070 RepID=A0AAD8ZWR0_9TELE|nr:hypothetical protein P4O66_000143 [Electrophorus voltai]